MRSRLLRRVTISAGRDIGQSESERGSGRPIVAKNTMSGAARRHSHFDAVAPTCFEKICFEKICAFAWRSASAVPSHDIL